MPYEMKVGGMETISETLTQLAEDAPRVAAMALYDGAGLMAEEIKKGAETIKTAPFKYASTAKGETRLPSPEEKEIVLQAAAGIAKFDKNGTEVDTSVGFRNAGYAELGGKTRPIPAIVNAINSGTSFMRSQPFFRRAARQAEPKVMKKMQETVESEWSKLFKEVNGKYGGR